MLDEGLQHFVEHLLGECFHNEIPDLLEQIDKFVGVHQQLDRHQQEVDAFRIFTAELFDDVLFCQRGELWEFGFQVLHSQCLYVFTQILVEFGASSNPQIKPVALSVHSNQKVHGTRVVLLTAQQITDLLPVAVHTDFDLLVREVDDLVAGKLEGKAIAVGDQFTLVVRPNEQRIDLLRKVVADDFDIAASV